MALALERMIAPVTGVPARPFTEETDSKLDISVVFTSVDATLTALKEAGNLASSLGGAHHAHRAADCSLSAAAYQSAGPGGLQRTASAGDRKQLPGRNPRLHLFVP